MEKDDYYRIVKTFKSSKIHTFIPFISSLALDTDNYYYNMSNKFKNGVYHKPYNSDLSPFDILICHTTSNDPHVDLRHNIMPLILDGFGFENTTINTEKVEGNRYYFSKEKISIKGDQLFVPTIFASSSKSKMFAVDKITFTGNVIIKEGAKFNATTKPIYLCNSRPIAAAGPQFYNNSELGQFGEEEDLEEKTPILSLYPNPSNGISTLSFNNSEDKEVNLVVYNAIGKKVHQETFFSNSIEINLTNHPKGIYLLKTTIGTETFVNKLTIK